MQIVVQPCSLTARNQPSWQKLFVKNHTLLSQNISFYISHKFLYRISVKRTVQNEQVWTFQFESTKSISDINLINQEINFFGQGLGWQVTMQFICFGQKGCFQKKQGIFYYEHSIYSQSVSLTQYVVLTVRPSACPSVPVSLLSKRPSSYCQNHFGGTLGAALGQKTTFNGRRPLIEYNL